MEKNTTDSDPQKNSGKPKPIVKKEDVQKSNDEHIDQDFPGFPHLPATEETIKEQDGDAPTP